MTKTALIIGITGQDGSYLAELLLAKGYKVHGIMRRHSTFGTGRIDHVFDSLTLHYGDVLDPLSLRRVLSIAEPDEVYNLAAQSHVKTSFEQPVYSAQVGAIGALHVLEAVSDYKDSTAQDVRVYQASSSEMFGNSLEMARDGQGGTLRPMKQNESTAFRPRSPYACAKTFAYWQTVNYREAYGLFAANGILFNHESPRRGETFVTRKITRAAARIHMGLQEKLVLGNLDASRDWGFAGDFVEAMWRILQHDEPDDFVVATGVSCTVRTWLEMAFSFINRNWEDYVTIDERYMRPTEVPYLRGDASKAERVLHWSPRTGLQALCDMMMKHDLELARQESAVDNLARAG